MCEIDWPNALGDSISFGYTNGVGQLDEDLSFYSTGVFENQILTTAPANLTADLTHAVSLYTQHGYTLAQEGAATLAQVQIYLDAIAANPNFPLTMAMLMYDSASADFFCPPIL